MKTILKNEFIGFESLTTLLCVGITGVLIDKLTDGPIRLLSILLGDGSVLQVQAKVTEVEPWHEVGTLILEHAANMGEGEVIQMPLSSNWLDIDSVEKLLLRDEKIIVESGVRICNRSGEQFVILPGAFPHSVEICADFYSGNFDPEYEFGEYERVPEVGIEKTYLYSRC